MKFGYNNKLISTAPCTKFIGLTIYRTLSWRMRIAHLMTKLGTACYVIRPIKPLMSRKTLLLIYHSLFHSHELLNNIVGIFLSQFAYFSEKKRVTRIIEGCGNRDSCIILFKQLKILPLTSQYILSLLLFVVNNRHQFLIISEIRNINTRHSSNLHLPSANLHIYQKRFYYSRVKIFNIFPFNINKFSDN